MREYVLKCKVEEVEKVMSDFINSIRCLTFEDEDFANFEVVKMDGFCAIISSMYLMEDTCKIGVTWLPINTKLNHPVWGGLV